MLVEAIEAVKELGRHVELATLPRGRSWELVQAADVVHELDEAKGSRHLMRLPNGHRAAVGTKLEDYALNMSHREGRHKARVFQSVLGITADNADVLRRALLDAAAVSDQVETPGDLLYRVSMESEIKMHDVVALLEDLPARHFDTGRPLLLRRGQVGTVIMTHDGAAVEVEFARTDGRAYAILPVPAGRLMVLRDTPEHAVA